MLQHGCTWFRCYELRISRRKHNFPLQHEQCYEVTDKKFHQTNLFFSSRWKHFLEPLKNSWKSKISKKLIVEHISKEKVSFSTNMHTSKESYCFKEKCQFHKKLPLFCIWEIWISSSLIGHWPVGYTSTNIYSFIPN